jgi:D-glycero-D-manno-heptose 1,7-bisphosphate phosphatase
MLSKALFLDRDGVINFDYGYVHKTEDFKFLPGVFNLVRIANALKFKVIVVTNQAGIGRGYYSEQTFQELTAWMCHEFEYNGGRINDVYFCPFHPKFGVGVYRVDSELRKPAPGMLLKAQEDHGIDMARSVIVGDSVSDMDAGFAANIGTLLFLGGGQAVGGAITISSLDDVVDYLRRVS